MATPVRNRSDSPPQRSWMIFGGALFALVLCLGSWLFWPTRVSLSEDGYQVAIALYRVCNQQDENGLQSIEAMLDEQNDDASKLAIRQIVSQAKSGNWRDAATACRKILDDQVALQRQNP